MEVCYRFVEVKVKKVPFLVLNWILLPQNREIITKF